MTHQLLIGSFFVTATLNEVQEGDLKGKILVKYASTGNIIRIAEKNEVNEWAKAVSNVNEIATKAYNPA